MEGSPSAGTAIGVGGEECQGQAVTVTGTVTFLPPAVAVMVTGLPVSVALLPVTVTVLPLTVAVAFAVSPLVAVMVQPVRRRGDGHVDVAVRPAATVSVFGVAASESTLVASPAFSAASRP